MGDPIPTMPVVDGLCKTTYTAKEWLNYYWNVWNRNLVARTIDVQTDTALKAINPEELVQADDGRQITVKERLELRKILVQDALNLLAGIKILMDIPDADFENKVWSAEALKVAEDMIPKEEPAPAPEATPAATPEAPASEERPATPGATPGQDAN